MYKALFSYAGNDVYLPAENEVFFTIYDQKGYRDELLKIADPKALELFTCDGPTSYQPKWLGEEKVVNIKVGGAYDTATSVKDIKTTTIHLGSFYTLGEIDSITIRYAFVSDSTHGWGDIAFNVNGIAQTYEQLQKVSMGHLLNPDGSSNKDFRTLTIQKSILNDLGMTDNTRIEKIDIRPITAANANINVESIKITEKLSKERFEELLKMNEEQSMILFSGGFKGVNIVKDESINDYVAEATTRALTDTATTLKGVYNLTIDLKSWYKLKDIESITIKYAIVSDSETGFGKTAFNVNGIATTKEQLDKLSMGYYYDGNDGTAQTTYRTLTISKALLKELGMDDETFIKNVVIQAYEPQVKTIRIAEIVIN